MTARLAAATRLASQGLEVPPPGTTPHQYFLLPLTIPVQSPVEEEVAGLASGSAADSSSYAALETCRTAHLLAAEAAYRLLE